MSQARIGAEPWTTRRALSEHGLLIFFLLLLGVGTLAAPAFATTDNIRNILTQGAPLGMVAIGQALVILVRGLDLSVASVMGTMAVIATEFNATSDAMIPVIFAVCLVLAAAIGFFNGWLITKRHVSPFLATLATMIVLQGIRFVITRGAPSGALPEGFRFLGTGDLFGVPVGFLALLLLAGGFWFLMHRTIFGRQVYLVGGNKRGADLVGIHSDRVVIMCYVLCSMCACIGGLFLTGYTGSIDNFVGRGYELQSIVAAVMGGVALTGGKGTIIGALIGAMILIALFNIILLLGFSIELQYIIQGVIIIAAASFYMIKERQRT